jgi:hypothetical protein
VNSDAPTPGSRGELAVAVAIGCCVVAVAYASMRLLQAWRYPDPDPRVILVTSRVAFYWRSLLALHVGVLGTIAARAAQRRFGSRIDRALPVVLLVTIVIGVAQGALVP